MQRRLFLLAAAAAALAACSRESAKAPEPLPEAATGPDPVTAIRPLYDRYLTPNAAFPPLETQAPWSAALQAQLVATRNFHAGLATVRQLEFALFDFRLHAEYDPAKGGRVAEILAEVRREVSVIQPPAWNRFPQSFGHIFAGGYAAGYYSYKWAEVLAADAFGAFEESGVFDRGTANRFLESILSRGGSRDALDAFVEFRGRKPDIQPLLRQHGIA